MLKILFWGLLLANGALFAFDHGLLGSYASGGREPARLLNQLNADKIRPIAPTPTPPAAAALLPVLPVATSAPQRFDCTEIGNFDLADAKRFEARWVASGADVSLTSRSVKDVARHMVYIPPQGDKESADRKAGELRGLGLTDFYVIQENSDLRWGISLGIFRTEESARTHLASLTARGVRSARLGTYGAVTNRVAFQLRNIDLATKSSLASIKADFPRQDVRDCGVN
ncbi:MAG: SPOR domain-containing protein [Herminiimonas sp.]|nr:SPOR domain-containing protein [Herminiimonas sp.]